MLNGCDPALYSRVESRVFNSTPVSNVTLFFYIYFFLLFDTIQQLKYISNCFNYYTKNMEIEIGQIERNSLGLNMLKVLFIYYPYIEFPILKIEKPMCRKILLQIILHGMYVNYIRFSISVGTDLYEHFIKFYQQLSFKINMKNLTVIR